MNRNEGINMSNVIKGTLETIDQAIEFIDGLTPASYKQVVSPWFESSVGQHLRHIVDLFHALMGQTDTLDYDVRRRGAPVEKNKSIGIEELREIRRWVEQLSDEALARTVTVSTEVSISSQLVGEFSSSFGRELCFASSHLVHHLAIMATIGKMTGNDVDSRVGLAPATASFSRHQEAEVCAH